MGKGCVMAIAKQEEVEVTDLSSDGLGGTKKQAKCTPSYVYNTSDTTISIKMNAKQCFLDVCMMIIERERCSSVF